MNKKWHVLPKEQKETPDGWDVTFVRWPRMVREYDENDQLVRWRWGYNEWLESHVFGSADYTWRCYREPKYGPYEK